MSVLILTLNHGDIALSSAKNSADGRRTTSVGKHDATGATASRIQVTHVHEESHSLRHMVVGGVHSLRDLLSGKLLTGLQSRQEHQNAERDIRECCQTHGYSFYPSRVAVTSTENFHRDGNGCVSPGGFDAFKNLTLELYRGGKRGKKL